MIQAVTRYQTTDGKLFEHEGEAMHHETRGKAELALDALFDENFTRTSSAHTVADLIKTDAKFCLALHEHLQKLGHR